MPISLQEDGFEAGYMNDVLERVTHLETINNKTASSLLSFTLSTDGTEVQLVS